MKNEPPKESEAATDATAETPAEQPDMDKAVDEITKHDSDELLKAEDAKHQVTEAPKRPWYKRLLKNKKIAIPAAVVLLLLILLAIPFTRYPILGLFLKDNYALSVWDSQSNEPVSAASVSLAGKTVMTDNHGVAHLKVSVGHHRLVVTKKYYTTLSSQVLVPLRSHAGTTPFSLQATGRPVPVTVTNKITGSPINDATIKAVDTEAHTDKNGQVTIVLPADKSSLSATITARDYNDASATIQVTTQAVKANDFQLTPAGKVYFLSKLSGKIDVVKTNLDGTDRQTVLPGTGNENDTSTVLLASRDWKFMALQSIRDTSNNAQLNLIDTSNDQLTNIDKGDASFSLTGWIGHSFVYLVNRNNLQAWQPNQTALKSFNADSRQLATVDQTQAAGDQNIYATENIDWIFGLGDKVVYFKTWTAHNNYGGTDYSILSGKQAEVMSLVPGSAKTTLKSFNLSPTAPSYTVLYAPLRSYNSALYEPNGIYFGLNSDNAPAITYDTYENGTVTENDSKSKSWFESGKTYLTYLLSPSGNQTFWSDSRDGKNTLFIGDQNGAGGKQIASLSDYDTYGWYTDNYVLVSKTSDELYIMPVAGGTPVKITDYHKPAQSFNGYGGGYGGK